MLLTWYFCSYKNDDITNYVICFEKWCKKWLKYFFFLKLTLWQPGKKFASLFDEVKTYVCCVFLSTWQSLSKIIGAYVGRSWTLTKSYKYRRFEDKMIRDHIVMNCISIDLWRHTTTAGKRPLSQITSRYLVKNRALR